MSGLGRGAHHHHPQREDDDGRCAPRLIMRTPQPRSDSGRMCEARARGRPGPYRSAMALTCTDILAQTPQGLYCALGDFHVDPIRPVPRALITHGHFDHARAGHGAVLATRETLRIMGARYGEDFAGSMQAAALREPTRIGEVEVSFVPAGHVLGSAQIVVEAGGCRVVISGDYKRAEDPTCEPFELVPCDV